MCIRDSLGGETSGTLTFQAGEQTKTLPVASSSAERWNGSRAFVVEFSDVSGALFGNEAQADSTTVKVTNSVQYAYDPAEPVQLKSGENYRFWPGPLETPEGGYFPVTLTYPPFSRVTTESYGNDVKAEFWIKNNEIVLETWIDEGTAGKYDNTSISANKIPWVDEYPIDRQYTFGDGNPYITRYLNLYSNLKYMIQDGILTTLWAGDWDKNKSYKEDAGSYYKLRSECELSLIHI